MTFVTAAVIAGGATLASSLIGANAANKAGKMQAGAADRAAQLQNEQFQQTRQDLAPYRTAGVNALSKLEGMADYTPFSMDTFSRDPGYGFRLSEGQKALDRQAAARGGLISGSALKAAQRFGQEMGSQEYQNAFNRYQIERNAKLGPYQSLAGVGQTTANQLGQFGATNAANVGNLMTGGAAANAAGQVGVANAFTGGVGQYLNYSQGNNLINALNQNRGSTYGYTPTTDYGVGADYGFSGRLGPT
jgi:hypothetical protein